MKYVLSLLLLLGAWCQSTAAETPPPATSSDPVPGPDSCRFLFVVETSASTRALQEANRSTLFDMIFTGLGGQMRSGDTYGVWTYNQETYAGQFPMQTWDAQNPMELASRAALFLAGQRYAGETRTEILSSKMRAVSRAVGDVIIFVISDGHSKFEGIAYADAINAEYQQRAKERSRAKKPFVTSFIAREGKIIGAYVAIAGQPLPLPERPAQIVTAPKTLRPTVAVAPKRAQPTVVPAVPPPVIAVAETPGTPAPEVSRLVVAPAPAVEAKAPDVIVAATPPPPPTPPTVAVSPPASAPAPTPTPTVPRTKVFEFITHSNSAAPKVEKVIVEAAVTTTNLPSQTQLEVTKPVPVIAKKEEPRIVPEAPVAPKTPAISAPAISETTPAIVKAPVITVSATVVNPPAPLASKPIPATVVEPDFPDALPVSARESSAAGLAEASNPLDVAAGPLTQGLSGGAQLAIGLLLLTAALFLIVVMLRRARPTPQPSLITRSMERR